jgi:outer membrane lipoprotein-sorting protein
MLNKKFRLIMGLILLLLFTSVCAHADVTVYAEGAYTETDLVVYIYADVETNPI